MANSVVIDCFLESVARYQDGYAIVAVDVVRATTTAITAVAAGHKCFLMPTMDAALQRAGTLDRALLAGEQGGVMPHGFDLDNSPVEVLALPDTERPIILLSSNGTRLCHEAAKHHVVFLACFRNYASVADCVARDFSKVAVIGAGSRGEFREEDQMCCAWIADALSGIGYVAENDATAAIIERWRGAEVDAWTCGNSARYLRDFGHDGDLQFILDSVADLNISFEMRGDEVVFARPGYSLPKIA